MKLLIVNLWIHHKNFIGLKLMLNYIKNNDETFFYKIGDLSDVKKEFWDVIYSPAIPINSSLYPKTRFLFGPHFSVYPDNKLMNINNRLKNSIYLLPSDGCINWWRSMGVENIIKIHKQYFPIDVDTFKPNDNNTNKQNEVFIYFKRRKQDELNVLENYLRENKINYKVFDYVKKYTENDYLKTLQNAKFGIILDAPESQGFAIEEALSCNVPLLVWNATSMSQEVGSNHPDVPCTSIPYWNEKCGEVFYKWGEFERAFNIFLKNIKNKKYNPRQFVLDELSVKPCSEKFVSYLHYNS